VLAAAGFNLKKMLRKLASSLNCQLKVVFCNFFALSLPSKKVAF